jgi:predicted N-acetyltransferase YhbS
VTGVHLRAALPEEAGLLSDVALRSKGLWGYPRDVLEQFRDELTVAPELIEQGTIVAEANGVVLGFAAVSLVDGETADLAFLFVEPAATGRGIGRLLWRGSLAAARRAGARTLRIESDPFAAGFYAAMGAERTGGARSRSVPARVLPVFEVSL